MFVIEVLVGGSANCRDVITCIKRTHFGLTIHCDRDVSKHISQVCTIIRITENCVVDFHCYVSFVSNIYATK